jgi:hypothetical protein
MSEIRDWILLYLCVIMYVYVYDSSASKFHMPSPHGSLIITTKVKLE